jgi:putative exporter of polyketide antibiotics
MKDILDFLKYVIDQPMGGSALFAITLVFLGCVTACVTTLFKQIHRRESKRTQP